MKLHSTTDLQNPKDFESQAEMCNITRCEKYGKIETVKNWRMYPLKCKISPFKIPSWNKVNVYCILIDYQRYLTYIKDLPCFIVL